MLLNYQIINFVVLRTNFFYRIGSWCKKKRKIKLQIYEKHFLLHSPRTFFCQDKKEERERGGEMMLDKRVRKTDKERRRKRVRKD